MVTGKTNTSGLLIDSSFKKENFNQYRLCLELAQDHISCCVFDTVQDHVLLTDRQALERYLSIDDLKSFLSQSHILEEYAAVTYCWKGFPSVLVPSGLFDASRTPNYFGLSHGYVPDQIDVIDVDSCGVKILSESIVKVDQFIQNKFPNALKNNNTALLLDQIQRKNRFVKTPQMFIEVDEKNSEFILFNGAELLYHNSFEVSSTEDVLYFLANISEQYNLSLEQINVFIAGAFTISGEEIKLISKYVKNVQVNMGYEYVKLALGMSGLRKQNFASLFNQYTCVL